MSKLFFITFLFIAVMTILRLQAGDEVLTRPMVTKADEIVLLDANRENTAPIISTLLKDGRYGYIGPTGGVFLAPIELPAKDSIPISNRSEFEAIRDNLGGSYHLVADIDLSDVEWVPIGNSLRNNTEYFSGVFDGQGYVIRNLRIKGAYESAGLFGHAQNAVFKNIGLEGTSIDIILNAKRSGETYAYAGGLVGYSGKYDYGGYYSYPYGKTSSFSNCYNTGDISLSSITDNTYVGGIVGYVNRLDFISYCYNTGSVSSKSNVGSAVRAYAGGIIGSYVSMNHRCFISFSYNAGSVYSFAAGTSRAGGISSIGYMEGTLNDCYNTGDISAVSSEHGASAYGIDISSKYDYNNRYINCYSIGKVSASAPRYVNVYGVGGSGSGVYWNTESTHMVNGAVLTNEKKIGSLIEEDTTIPLTSTQMRQQSSYTNFDFDKTWIIDPEINYGYPIFQTQSGVKPVTEYRVTFDSVDNIGSLVAGVNKQRIASGNHIPKGTDIIFYADQGIICSDPGG